MDTTEKSQGRVRSIVDNAKGQTLVSFDNHDAYFIAGPDVVEALKAARDLNLVVHFTYDFNLNIKGVVAHHG